MFAGVHGVDRHAGVPVVNRRHANGVDIISFQKFPVIFVTLAITADGGLGRFEPFGPDIGDGGLLDVGVAGVGLLAAHMGHALATDADVADDDPVIGSDDATGRGRLGLAIDGGL